MRIAVIGAGAMGSIYGGHLSAKNEVILIDKSAPIVQAIHQHGLTLMENEIEQVFHPQAQTNSQGVATVDLVILFVKALYSRAALAENRALLGAHTYVMTLQNGSGHEEILKEFVPLSRIIIGTTEDNGAVLTPARVRHGGEGRTHIGMLVTDKEDFLPRLQATLNEAGFQAHIHTNIQQLVWDKLFTNISLSAVTGILQVPMGFIAQNSYAWQMTQQLVHEAITVAQKLGLTFDEETMLQRIRETSAQNPDGLTSLYADLHAGRKTEVDTISGSVLRAAAKVHVPVPTHTFLVAMVHALEAKTQQ